MQLHIGFNDLNLKNAVVTTGSFDGVHVGHKVIISRLNELAKIVNGESVLITFHPHPRKVLYPETVGKDLKLINSQKEKIELLKETGLDHLIIVNFTKEFSQTSSYDFVTKILLQQIGARVIVVGFNHHFGHNKEGNYEYLYKLTKTVNFIVEEIPEQDIQNETVSSTKIRKALTEGKIQRANAYLDHEYIVYGQMQLNGKRELHDGLLEIEDDMKLLPADGYYAVTVKTNTSDCKAMAKVRNTEKPLLFLYLIDQTLENTETAVVVYFHKEIMTNIMNEDNGQYMSEFSKCLALTQDLIY